jgi:hypothetical protein
MSKDKSNQNLTINIIRFQLYANLFFYLVLATSSLIEKKYKIGLNLWGYLTGNGRFDDLTNSARFGYSNFNYQAISEIKTTLTWPNSPLISLLSQIGQFFVSGPQDAPFVTFVLYLILLKSLFGISSNKLYGWLVVTNFPIIFLFSRGNPDILTLAIIVIILKNISIKNSLVAILIGIIAGIKFPFLLLAFVFIVTKEYKKILVAITSFILSNVVPIIIMPFTFSDSLRAYLEMLKRYNQVYILQDGGTLWNNSFYGFCKSIYFLINKNRLNSESIDSIRLLLNFNYAISALFVLISITILYKASRQLLLDTEMLFLSIFLLTVTAIIIGPISATYRIALLVPFFLMALEKFKSLTFTEYLLFTLICLPKTFLYFTSSYYTVGFTLDSIINPVLIFVLWVRLMRIIGNYQPSQNKT